MDERYDMMRVGIQGYEVADEDRKDAALTFVIDVSGSMGEFEKYVSRSFYFWMVRFLRTKYNNVQIVFISHHTEAREVSEEQFFTQGESGGTVVSSAYRLALEIIVAAVATYVFMQLAPRDLAAVLVEPIQRQLFLHREPFDLKVEVVVRTVAKIWVVFRVAFIDARRQRIVNRAFKNRTTQRVSADPIGRQH